MEYIIGIILLLSFFGLAYYCIKGHNLMIGFLIITVIWTVLPLFGTLFASPAFIESNPVLQFGAGTDTKLVSILNKISRALLKAGAPPWLMCAGARGSDVY